MSDEINFLKARYCQSILRTASIWTDHDRRRFVDGLTTEVRTVGVSASVEEAERQALEAIHALASHLVDRSVSAASGEWLRATMAIDAWVRAAAS